jgi:glycosyltransferase involved in cell wall biosynthesis
MKTTLIIPTKDEIEGVKAVMPRINRRWADQIIVVDANSTDGTLEYLRKRKYRIVLQKRRGYGAGIKEAMEHARGGIIIEFTPDGNSIPEKIPALVRKMGEGYDLVIASRYKDGAKSYDDDILTRFGNRFFTELINLLFGSSYTDTQVAFRAYRRECYEKVKEKMDADGLTWCGQISIVFRKNKFRICEIPADEPKRIGGKRKMSPVKTGWAILSLIIRERFRG